MGDNLPVTIEKFLSFWSQNTTVIIEALFAVVILFSLFLAYRSFFGAKAGDDAGHGSGAGQNLDTAQLEKTLQKILENQSHAPKHAAEADLSAHGDIDLEAQIPRATAATDGASAAEISQLRTSLSDSSKKIEILQAQLLEAQQTSAAQASAAPAAEAGGGLNEELNAKLRDLEARLAEYEIISEDIADLSRYRDENEDLKKQIEALKANVGTAPAAAAPAAVAAAPSAPAPEPVVAAAAPVEPEPAPPVEAFAAPAMDDMEAAVAALAEQPAEEKVDSELIDDELMKEFAAAVEGQKGLDKAAEKAGDGSAKPAASGDDTDKLMDQFENFVTKKS